VQDAIYAQQTRSFLSSVSIPRILYKRVASLLPTPETEERNSTGSLSPRNRSSIGRPAAGNQLMNRPREAFANARQFSQPFDALLSDDFIQRTITITHDLPCVAMGLHPIWVGLLRFEESPIS
jgi:hypothetical protein